MDVFTFVTHVSAFMSQRTTLGKYLALPRTDFLISSISLPEAVVFLSLFACACLSWSPSPLLLTSHLYPLKQTRCKGSQHCCANEKNAGFTLGFQHHICLNTVTLVNCNVMGDYIPLLSLSLSLRSPFSLCSFTPSSLLVVGIFWQLSHYTVKSILFACFHFTYSTCIVNNLTAKMRYLRLLARLLFISAFLQSWFF